GAGRRALAPPGVGRAEHAVGVAAAREVHLRRAQAAADDAGRGDAARAGEALVGGPAQRRAVERREAVEVRDRLTRAGVTALPQVQAGDAAEHGLAVGGVARTGRRRA